MVLCRRAVAKACELELTQVTQGRSVRCQLKDLTSLNSNSHQSSVCRHLNPRAVRKHNLTPNLMLCTHAMVSDNAGPGYCYDPGNVYSFRPKHITASRTRLFRWAIAFLHRLPP